MRRTSIPFLFALGASFGIACGQGTERTPKQPSSAPPPVATRSSLSATPICTAAELTACANANLSTPQCLTLFQACGRYLEIIEHYKSEAWSTDPSKWYYLGVAYNGLLIQTRSHAARCQFGGAARFALQAYLHQSYKDQGYNDQRTFQQTYHATKVLNSLATLTGCDDSAMTPDELYNATYAHGKALAESLFLGDAPPGPLHQTLVQTKASIQSSIQGFVSKASNIETQIGLRKVAMDQSDARILKVADLLRDTTTFAANIALVTDPNGRKPSLTSATLPAMSPFLTQQSLYLPNFGYNQRAKAKLDEVTAALGASSIPDYEAKRALIVGYARDTLTASAGLLQSATATTTPALTTALKTAADAAAANSDDGSAAYIALKAQWKAYGDSIKACTLASPPWYCK